MKIQIRMFTPLGSFESNIRECSSEEVKALHELLKQNMDYLVLTDVNGHDTFFKKETIANSMIQIIKVED